MIEIRGGRPSSIEDCPRCYGRASRNTRLGEMGETLAGHRSLREGVGCSWDSLAARQVGQGAEAWKDLREEFRQAKVVNGPRSGLK